MAIPKKVMQARTLPEGKTVNYNAIPKTNTEEEREIRYRQVHIVGQKNAVVVKDDSLIGYCQCDIHKGFITPSVLKNHQCLAKACPFLQRFPEKPFWKHREKQQKYKEKEKEKKKDKTLSKSQKIIDECCKRHQMPSVAVENVELTDEVTYKKMYFYTVCYRPLTAKELTLIKKEMNRHFVGTSCKILLRTNNTIFESDQEVVSLLKKITTAIKIAQGILSIALIVVGLIAMIKTDNE